MKKLHILSVLLLLFTMSCNRNLKTPATNLAEVKQIGTPSQVSILFKSNRNNEVSWYLMAVDGSQVRKISFEKLAGKQTSEIIWVPELESFIMEISGYQIQPDYYVVDWDGNIKTRLTNDLYGESDAKYNKFTDKIAYTCFYNDLDICLVSLDGSKFIDLTAAPSRDSSPLWIARGSKIVFVSNRSGVPGIWSFNTDGSDLKSLSTNLVPEDNPAVSPDEKRIAFRSMRDLQSEVYIMNSDGTEQRNLTNNPAEDSEPKWAPNNELLAFRSNRDNGNDIYVMNVDGSNVTNVTNTHDIYEDNFLWSPDGERIIYSSKEGGNSDIFSVKKDGSDKVNLTRNPADDVDPILITLKSNP